MSTFTISTENKKKPREKMLSQGAASLRDDELLAILLQTGIEGKTVYQLAGELDRHIKQADGVLSPGMLTEICGVGEVKALKILASIEYAKRLKNPADKKISSASDIYKLVFPVTDKLQEYFILITLNGASLLIKKRTLFIGTVNRSIVHPREVFAHALHDRASSIILVHNHPSGNVFPSEEDVRITQRISEIGELMDIRVADHVIVTKNDYYSFAVHGLMNSMG